ncbi:12324_t:CDS:2, partial [Dentiscutata heterogama]
KLSRIFGKNDALKSALNENQCYIEMIAFIRALSVLTVASDGDDECGW